MEASIPQFDYSTFASQLFWLTLTYVIFYIVMSCKIIPRLREVSQKRKNLIDQITGESLQMQNDVKTIESECTNEAETANNEAYRIISSLRDNIEKDFNETYASMVREVAGQMKQLDKKLGDIKNHNRSHHDQYADEIANIIVNTVRKSFQSGK